MVPITAVADWVSHLLPYSSVDAGEIRWGGSNWYSSNRSSSISSWNGLGIINIAADTSSTYEDLHFSDVYRSDLIWAGLHTYWGAATDTIEMNNFYLDQYSSVITTTIFVHELGHALGLADIEHPDYSKYGPWPSVMYFQVDGMPNGIQSSDIDNYNLKW